MAETYSNYDTWNVVKYHVVQALQADSYLKTGGTLAVKTWDQELPEDAGVYQANLLPAVAVEVVGQYPEDEVGFPDYVDWAWQVVIGVVVAGGELSQVKILTKRYVARVIRVLLQQHVPTKQLLLLPSAISGADTGSARVRIVQSMATGGRLEASGSLRGIGEVVADVLVGVKTPVD